MYEQYQIREEDSIEWFGDNAKRILDRYQGPKNLLIDLGAHVGLVSVLAVKEYGFNFAIAVEPNLENYIHLVENIAIGDCEGSIFPIWAAIAERSYQPTFLYTIPAPPKSIRDKGKWLNSGTHSSEFQSYFPKQRVVSLHLSDIFNSHQNRDIDFLKMDIEGAEWRTLTPSNEYLFNQVGYIDIELHPEMGQGEFRDPKKIGSVAMGKKYFERLGFQLTKNPETHGYYGHRI